MKNCPLCGLAIDSTDLMRHYLQDEGLVAYIQTIYPGWKPEDGACAPCLESMAHDHISKNMNSAPPEDSGEEKTVITEAPEMIPSSLKSQPSVVVIHGVDFGRKFDLDGRESIIGRGEHSQIRLNEDNVSRVHAKILNLGEEILIEDQDSTNGTFVNTRKVKTQPLKDGDLILIGNTILKFMSGSNVENQYHEEIYRLATLDGLTQLFNKAYFLEKLEDEFSRSKRYGRDLALLMFDFDHFKAINDTYGHQAGDEVLKKTAFIILKNMRKEDICGRYGGEEFGLLLPETPKVHAVQLAEKIRKLVKRIPYASGGDTFSVTISLGVAYLNPSIDTSEDFIAAADKALYQAKKDGRDCVRS